jgi:exodeoxyribonuclease-1
MVTGLTPATLGDQRLDHIDMMAHIARILSDCRPAMLIGFNTIRFDDEVLRQSFFQTLLPPYSGSATGGGRADVLNMLRAVAMLEPDAVVIPRDRCGKPSMRLGDVCRANSIALSEDDAHDALADVRATRDLFRLLREQAPATITTMMLHAKKSGPLALLDGSELLVLGGASGCVPIMAIVASPTNPNAWASVDLNRDPRDFIDLNGPELLALIRSRASPIRQVRVNAQPLLFSWDQGAHALADRQPDQIYRERMGILWRHPTFARHLVLALQDQYADRAPSQWPEGTLYEGGFISNADAAACARWHQLPWSERAGYAARHIADPRLKRFAIRQVFLCAPEALSSEAWQRGQTWLQERLLTQDDVPWATLPNGLARCEELAGATTEPGELAQLARIRAWLGQRMDALAMNSSAESVAALPF